MKLCRVKLWFLHQELSLLCHAFVARWNSGIEPSVLDVLAAFDEENNAQIFYFVTWECDIYRIFQTISRTGL